MLPAHNPENFRVIVDFFLHLLLDILVERVSEALLGGCHAGIAICVGYLLKDLIVAFGGFCVVVFLNGVFLRSVAAIAILLVRNFPASAHASIEA